MFVSILLGRFGPRLLPAVVIGFILFFLLTWYCYRSRHKRAKLRLEPKLSNDLYVESLSELPVVEETTADPGSNEIEEEELVTSYCNNGCQGACACPRIDLNRNVTLSEPTLSTPLQDEALDYHFAGVTRPDSESNLRQRRLIQHLKERFAKNFGIDLDHDSHRSRRILGIPVFPVFSRKTSVYDKDSNDKEKGSNKSASHKEINLRCTMKKAIKGGLLKKAGANKKGENSSQASNDSSNFGSSAEVRKEGSQAKVNERERESVSDNGDDLNEQKKRDSLRLLKGMSSFKKTSSLDGENQSLDSINQVVEK